MEKWAMEEVVEYWDHWKDVENGEEGIYSRRAMMLDGVEIFMYLTRSCTRICIITHYFQGMC